MALYTRKGDDGKTGDFGTEARASKGSSKKDAVGTLDELNSLIGLVKVKCDQRVTINDQQLSDFLHRIQNDLFSIQSEIAGADKSISEEKAGALEEAIEAIEQELPPVKSFIIAGGMECAALLDLARTVARRAERYVVYAIDDDSISVTEHARSYLNRLSSALFALARLVNYRSGITEESPDYR